METKNFKKYGFEKPQWIFGDIKRLDYTKTIFEVDHEQ